MGGEWLETSLWERATRPDRGGTPVCRFHGCRFKIFEFKKIVIIFSYFSERFFAVIKSVNIFLTNRNAFRMN